MARDYDTIHYIQNQMAGLDDKLISVITRMHSRMESYQLYSSALSTSITLFLAMKYLGVSPKLILGTIQFQGLSYPHSWIELDEKIYDLATHEDIKYHPVLKDRDLTLINPMVNVDYDKASEHICYYPFQFGGTWELANMYKTVGKTFEKYMDESLYIDILADACYILEITETPENLDCLRSIAKLETIKDKDDVSKHDDDYAVRDEQDAARQHQNNSKSFCGCIKTISDWLRKSNI